MKNTLPTTRKTMREYEQAVNEAKTHYANAIKLLHLGNDKLSELGKYMEPSAFSSHKIPRIEDINSEIDRRAWRKLMSVTGLQKTFDRVAMEAFDKSLETDPPEFTESNAAATIQGLMSEADTMFKRGLVELFRRLSGEYKSHSAFKINRRMILGGVRGFNGVAWDKHDTINDLDRVLCELTGREFVPNRLVGEFDNALLTSGEQVFEDGYIKSVFYLNGNAHITIKDDALVDKINNIIAGWYGNQLAS